MDDNSETEERSPSEEDEVDTKSKNRRLKVGDYYGRPPPSLISGQLEDAIYSLEYRSKGQCHIFSHKKFYSSEGECTYFEGPELDAELLQGTFKKLGFDVTLHKDYIFSDIYEKICRVSNSEADHSKYGSLICCFLSYGSQTEIYAADGSYDIERVYDRFYSALPGKPKIFIFQALPPSSNLNLQKVYPKSKQFQPTPVPNIFQEPTDLGEEDSVPKKQYYVLNIPFCSDLLIASSTFSGCYTFPNGQEASDFIRLLCLSLWRYGERLDFEKILTLVNSELVHLFESPELEEYFQFRSSLTRKLMIKSDDE